MSSSAVCDNCSVCGDRATKLRYSHYGATSCFSCRAFFRRAVEKNASFSVCCLRDRRCEIRVATRKKCPYCRFQKCLDVGMTHVRVSAVDHAVYTSEDDLLVRELARIDREDCCNHLSNLSDASQEALKSFVSAAGSGGNLEFSAICWAYAVGMEKLTRFAQALRDFGGLGQLEDKKALLLSNLDPMFNIRMGHFFTCQAQDFLEQMQTLAIFDVSFFQPFVGCSFLPTSRLRWDQFFGTPWTDSREHRLKYESLMGEIRKLHLDTYSVSLFNVVALLATDEKDCNCCLVEAVTMRAAQAKYVGLLRRYLKHSRGEERGEELFVAYMALLGKLREMADIVKTKTIRVPCQLGGKFILV